MSCKLKHLALSGVAAFNFFTPLSQYFQALSKTLFPSADQLPL
jgi:hypothetical protein